MARILAAFFSAVLMAASAGASTITWGPATDTTGPSDVSLAGFLVTAVDMAGVGATVNGVAFQNGFSGPPHAFSGLVNRNFAFADGADLGDPDFTELLRTAGWSGRGPGDITLTGLTPGFTYDLQIFFMDQRGCCNDRHVTLTSGLNQVTLAADPGNGLGAPFGQFTIGTFVADAATQGLAISGEVVTQVNAWQLREIAIPEPGSLLLVGSGVTLLAQRRRRTSRA